MGMRHEAKKGTIIQANGVTIIVLRGSPCLEISAPHDVAIRTSRVNTGSTRPRHRKHATVKAKARELSIKAVQSPS
jgi:hypothetical protein